MDDAQLQALFEKRDKRRKSQLKRWSDYEPERKPESERLLFTDEPAFDAEVEALFEQWRKGERAE